MKKYYRIGISGHRDLVPTQRDEHISILKRHLLKTRQDHPDRKLLILSPLADGADRLIVNVAQKLGIEYKVILPMPKSLYIKDFSQKSLKEFEFLLQHAKSVETIDLYAGNTLQLISTNSIYRNFQYRQGGRRVVELSDEMIIMSDGIKNNKMGGTEDIVNYANIYGKISLNIRCNRLKG